MAMNVWNSRGAGPRRDTLGLGEVADRKYRPGDDVGALADRLKTAAVPSPTTPAPNCASRIRGATGSASPSASAPPGPGAARPLAF